MKVCPALVADAQALELVQPCERALGWAPAGALTAGEAGPSGLDRHRRLVRCAAEGEGRDQRARAAQVRSLTGRSHVARKATIASFAHWLLP
ncbi:hypothetical protein [Streptomyces sp. E5N298]|uniref:hypothetical protein n=1 Tax=Streptomyces sp. E5N298 TaxID=1851983 RepID=UPI00187D677B|nr:hypothetical protein [Streptomyces sp. E5N298]